MGQVKVVCLVAGREGEGRGGKGRGRGGNREGRLKEGRPFMDGGMVRVISLVQIQACNKCSVCMCFHAYFSVPLDGGYPLGHLLRHR